jgi:multimeric flavodoxin WrbA/protein-tyrosine-phosphatase
MFVLGLQGSPRKKGNCDFLLSALLAEAEKRGARTRTVDVVRGHIEPCRELVVCEKKGICPIDDDMKKEVYGLLWEADVVVAASPVFFYNVTAQLKALIDRCQTLWARKYRLKLTDPGRPTRRGFLLSVAATRGKQLFDGIDLTVEYFFDAVGARSEGGLTYRGIEHRGDMERHPGVMGDVRQAAEHLTRPFRDRPKLLFVGRNNAGASRMAGAFVRFLAGDRLEAHDAGLRPAARPEPAMVRAMHERGIDMGFRLPQSLDHVLSSVSPDVLVEINGGTSPPVVSGAETVRWDLPQEPDGDFRQLRDTVEKRVEGLIRRYAGNPG